MRFVFLFSVLLFLLSFPDGASAIDGGNFSLSEGISQALTESPSLAPSNLTTDPDIFSEPSPTSSPSPRPTPHPRTFIFQPLNFLMASAVLGMMIVILVRMNNRNRRNLGRVRAIIQERRRQEALDVEANNAVRYEEILSKFHIQKVKKDKSNVSPEYLRNKSQEEEEEEVDQIGDTLQGDQTKEIVSQGIRSVFSNWRNPPEECCICLEHYSPGESICVAKNTDCNHLFQ